MPKHLKLGRSASSGRLATATAGRMRTKAAGEAGAADRTWGWAVNPKSLSERLGITQRDLAETAGLPVASLQRRSRASAPGAVARLTEVVEIIHRVSGWAGGEKQAFAWYRAQPIPAFGGRTAENLVKSGKAASLRDYLDQIALGGFA